MRPGITFTSSEVPQIKGSALMGKIYLYYNNLGIINVKLCN